DADDAVLAHQTGHALLADADPALLEVRVDPKRAVRAVRLGVRSSDGSDDLGVTLGPRGRWALQPGVEAAPGDSEDLGHARDGEGGLLRSHELEGPDGTEPVSRANQAAAF